MERVVQCRRIHLVVGAPRCSHRERNLGTSAGGSDSCATSHRGHAEYRSPRWIGGHLHGERQEVSGPRVHHRQWQRVRRDPRNGGRADGVPHRRRRRFGRFQQDEQQDRHRWWWCRWRTAQHRWCPALSHGWYVRDSRGCRWHHLLQRRQRLQRRQLQHQRRRTHRHRRWWRWPHG